MVRLVTLVHLSINVIFWMHTVGTAHGNKVWPPWITLTGCFNLNSNNETSNIQKNEPTQCFEMCSGFQSVGLKNMLCICNPLYTSSGIRTNRICHLPCPGKSEVYCGSDGAGNELMSVYRRDVPLPDDTSGSSSYGYGYVVVSGGNRKYYASDNNTSLRCGYMCYNDVVSPGLDPCLLEKSTSFTWEGAITACNARSARLITVTDVSKCRTGAAFDGTYWIGIYREKPDFTSSSSTSTTPTHSLKTASRPSHNSATPVIEQIEKVAAPVAVIGVTILVMLASILICKNKGCLCFKENQKRNSPPRSPNVTASRTT